MKFSDLEEYLSAAHDYAVKLPEGKPVHVVMGNEAGDLDSVFSAMCLGFVRTTTNEDDDFIMIPVVNFPKEDFVLRPELKFMNVQNKWHQDQYVFVDEIDLASLASQGLLSLTLTDHNQLAKSQSDLGACVVEIIDHHEDKHMYDDQLTNKVVTVVGSACTLVADEFQKAGIKKPDRMVRSVLASVIRVDCYNMLGPDAEGSRTTQLDIDMEQWLRGDNEDVTEQDAKEMHDAIVEAKNDISELSAMDNLRRDYKEFDTVDGSVTFGVAAVLTTVQNFVKLSDCGEALVNWRAKRNLDVLFVMFAYSEEGKFGRQMIVFYTDGEMEPKVTNALEDPEIGTIEPIDVTVETVDGAHFSAWDQLDLSKSRKKTTPGLEKNLK